MKAKMLAAPWLLEAFPLMAQARCRNGEDSCAPVPGTDRLRVPAMTDQNSPDQG